jgi:DNA-binding GntR family transcriptional regulator
MLNIGRTPVHQALDRLMIEGLVEVIPRKGVIVKPITLNEVLNIIDLRLLNESYCARLAAVRADANDIATLSEILKNTEHWSSQRDVEKMMLLDREFHQAVAKASKNEILADLLKALQERSLRFWFISLNEPGHFRSVQQEHFEVLKGILERDPDMAERAMRLHIESFRSNVSKFL